MNENRTRDKLGRLQKDGRNICKVDGCGKFVKAYGLCSMHDERMKRHGDVNWVRHPQHCSIDGCSKPYKCRGYCASHWVRWKKYGNPLGVAIRKQRRKCSVKDCNEFAQARGYCVFHYGRWHTGYKLDAPRQNRYKKGQTCIISWCDNPADSLGYCRTHYRAYKILGRVDPISVFGNPPYTCYICGEVYNTWGNGNLHIDHVIPTSLGGLEDISNLKLACASCNQVKTNLTINELLSLCKKILIYNS